MRRIARWQNVALLVFALAVGPRWVAAQGAPAGQSTSAQNTAAQGLPGAIQGAVSDTQQLPVPGTAVEVLDAHGTSVQKVIDLSDGTYRVADLPAGTYTVQFSHDGFQLVRKDSVVVTAGQTVTVNATLAPQSLNANVTVTATVNDQNVASKSDIPVSAMPVTVESVARDMIDQQASTEIVSVLNNMPTTYAYTDYGSLDYWEFRGLMQDNNYNSAQLLNGIPILGNVSDSLINSVQEVDVLKGPASMLYGTQDPGGTVNIVEKWPVAESQQDLVLHGGYWGTNGLEFGTTGPLTKSGNLLYRVDVGYMDSNGFRGDAYKKLNLSPKLFWRITPKDRLKLNLHWNDDRFGMDSGIPLFPLADPIVAYQTGAEYGFIIPLVNINTRYNTPGDFERLNYPTFQVFYEHDFNDHMTLRSSAQFQYGSDEYWQNELNAIDVETTPYTVLRGPQPPTGNPYPFSLFFWHHDYIGFNQDDLTGSFHLLFKHQYMIGYELDQFYHRTQRSNGINGAPGAQIIPIPSETLLNPVESSGAVTYFPAAGLDAYDGIRYWQNAVYFQDFMNILPKLQVLVGGRYDGYYTYTWEEDQNGSGGLTYSTTNCQVVACGAFAQHPFTYRVGVTSPLLPYMTLYANYSTSFTAQSELSTAGNALKPESGKQIEAGARFRFLQDRINMNFAYFHIVEDNEAVTIADGTIVQNANQLSYGGEAELRARVTPKFNVYATYGINPTHYSNFFSYNYWNYYATVISLNGAVPPLVPKVTERTWVTYQLPRGFLVMLGDHYVSRRTTDIYDLFWMPSYLTFDAGITYKRARMEYSLNIENLTNRTYWVAAIDDTEVYPGQPFNLVATARFHFGKE